METPPPYIGEDNLHRKSKISADMLVQAFRGAWSRFPVTMIYVMYATVWAIVYIIGEGKFVRGSERVVGALWYLGGVGIPLSLAVTLWCEYLGRQLKWPMIVANVLLWADCVYILISDTVIGDAFVIGRVAVVTALCVAILFVPSRRLWAWNYTNRQTCGLITAGVFSWAFSLAVSVIWMTVISLFDIKDGFTSMTCAMVVCTAMIPTVIFLHLIPRRDEVEATEGVYKASKFQCGTAKYFVLMITAVYMCILYVYGAKILFTWDLPRGVLTFAVSGLSLAVLVSMFMLEGVRRTHPTDTLTLRALRILPVAMLPLLVLMSVGLAYRVNQYGITPTRLYVITFNLWCYAVFGYLSLRRTRTYNGVAISFAVVFFATSILPYANLTDIGEFMQRESDDMDDVHVETVELTAGDFSNHIIKTMSSWVAIPEGYDNVQRKDWNVFMPKTIEDGVLIVDIGCGIKVPVDSIMKMKSSESMVQPVILHQASGRSDTIYVAYEVNVHYSEREWNERHKINSLNMSGYIFTKKE